MTVTNKCSEDVILALKYNNSTKYTQINTSVPLELLCNYLICSILKLELGTFYYLVNNKHPSNLGGLPLKDILAQSTSQLEIKVHDKLPGGKGGFGALLRGQRRANKRIKNYDACKDLTGRRIRHTKTLERLTAWVEKKKADDELVAALTCGLNDPQISAIESKINQGLQKVGVAYSEGIKHTQEKTLEAIDKTFSSKPVEKVEACTESKKDTLASRYISDVYEYLQAEDDSEDDSIDNLSVFEKSDIKAQIQSGESSAVSCN